MRIFALVLSVALSVNAVELANTRLPPDIAVVDGYMKNDCGYSSIIARRRIVSNSLISDDGTVSYPHGITTELIPFKEEPFYTPADRRMDQDVLDVIADNRGITALSYAKACYGSAAVSQISRSVLARAEHFVENPYTAASQFLYNPANLPVRPPDARMIRLSSVKFPRRGANANIRIAGRLVGTTNAAEVVSEDVWLGGKCWKMMPAQVERLKNNDRSGISYCMPGFGVAIHRPSDYAHEVAHYFNWAIAAESSAIIGYDLTWAEFLPAFHGLKVHAFRKGYDLGTGGAFAEYFASIDFNADIERELSRDAYQLLLYYRDAATAEGTENDTAGKRNIRDYCRSDAIGREVL